MNTRSDPPAATPSPYGVAIIIGMVVLVVATMISVVIVAIMGVENSAVVIASIIGISTPILLGMLGMLINGLTRHINSRMTELITLTRTSARAEGALEGAAVEAAAAGQAKLASQEEVIDVNIVQAPGEAVTVRDDPDAPPRRT